MRSFGHDVLTVQEAGNANQRIPDPDVLAFAISNQRAVLTLNRSDFIYLHKLSANHSGIIVCTATTNFVRLGEKIHEAVKGMENLEGQLLRIYRDT